MLWEGLYKYLWNGHNECPHSKKQFIYDKCFVGIGQINKCLNHYAIHAIVNVTYLTRHHQNYPCNPIQSTVLSFFFKYFDELQKWATTF